MNGYGSAGRALTPPAFDLLFRISCDLSVLPICNGFFANVSLRLLIKSSATIT